MESEEKNSLTRVAKLFLPFFIFAIVVLILRFILEGGSSMKLFILMFAYFIPPLGKESIIPIGVTGGEITIPVLNIHVIVPVLNPLIIALTIAFVDIIVALFLVWNYDLAKKIPLVGKFMKKVEDVGRSSSVKYGWIKPLRFIGIVLFVMVPFQGSGGLVGFIIGRLLGMKPWNVFLAISTGSVTGCMLIAYFADAVRSVFIQNFLFGILIIIILVVITTMILFYKKTIQKL
jgi:uncharacterized membrane protein